MLVWYFFYQRFINLNYRVENSHFYYDTKEKMDGAIQFWLDSYQDKWFVRLAIVDKKISKAIGTIEMFHRPSDDAFDGDGLIRLDVRPDYEKSEEIQSIFALLIPEAYTLLECEEIITKIPLYAVERIDAAKKIGFEKTDRLLVGSEDRHAYKNYWAIRK